ncbi:hypothetical protein LCGC14_2470400 [marine sediment metagenome]|uniref:Uncharacterized protein n=1 Tax=marine sediment metagenome TaxID=412755 RepID=A0A0F8VBE5_9ZZZZ
MKNDLEMKVEKIEKELELLKNKVIGEVFCFYDFSFDDVMYYIPVEDNGNYNGHHGYARFCLFTAKDITDNVGDNIKIKNGWFKKSDVVFYSDIYDKQRNVIKKRKQNTEKEGNNE